MAILTIPKENRTIERAAAIAGYLAGIDVDYEIWEPSVAVAADAPAEEILAAYSIEIDKLKESGGYITADVIDVKPQTPGLDEMLAKFNREHWHDDDEVRFIIEGRGLFHLHPENSPVAAIEVEAGDLIRVPSGCLHWFNLCADRRIRAIRLFKDPAGWTPHYTASGVDGDFQPLCFGPSYIPALAQ
ncbi:MAG TPA: cupin domain-containing protein [Blastocatellia bacterium]|jgi:1,2-dihydroxy-3-keto-5-methylthiopentene dioxygenase|nr:cupin domain-containing protein [Blastocatellia bacterium]